MSAAEGKTASAPAVPSLLLPPSQFARLQPHAYLLAHLSPPASSNQSPIRANGRTPLEFRPFSVNTGSLTNTNGSAVVRIGDTAAVCGVRADILQTSDIPSWGVSSSTTARKRRRTQDSYEDDDDDDSQIHDFNLLVPNLSLSTGCAPGFVPGAPPSALAQSLSHKLLSLLHTSRLVRAEDLRIWYQPPDLDAIEREKAEEDRDRMQTEEDNAPGRPKPEIRGFWVLYIDVMMISLSGNALDAAWAAVVAALRDTKLPKAWWDTDNEMILCSDEVSEARTLNLRGLPVASSYSVFEADAAAGWRATVIPEAGSPMKNSDPNKPERWILADPDGFEDSLCDERVSIVVDQDSEKSQVKIISIEKVGGISIGKDAMRELVDVSMQRWKQVKAILEGTNKI